MHQVHSQELESPAVGDLRHRGALPEGKDDVALFGEMELGDTWPDAFLWPSFEYLYRCKHTRTACGMVSGHARRIPAEWKVVMDTFADEWVSRRNPKRLD